MPGRQGRFESAMLQPKLKLKKVLPATDPMGPVLCLALVMPRCCRETGRADPLPQTVSGVAQPLA
jgi:hypothetical protein